MRYRRKAGLNSLVACLVASVALLQVSGCLYQSNSQLSIVISGHVRRETDSTGVDGAFMLVKGTDPYWGVSGYAWTDQNGHYEYDTRVYGDEGDPLEIRLTVIDMDGDTGGVFVSRDSTLSWQNTEGVSGINASLDFYVHMVGEGELMGNR